MLQYERIDISEGIYFNKKNKSVERMICHYWYFKDIEFKYQPYLSNGCHDLSVIVQNSWKEFEFLENIDQKYYCSDYYDVSATKYGVKCGTSLRFWENKGSMKDP